MSALAAVLAGCLAGAVVWLLPTLRRAPGLRAAPLDRAAASADDEHEDEGSGPGGTESATGAVAAPASDDQAAVGPQEVADAIDLLALALTSGAAVTSCLDLVAEQCPGRVGAELRQVSAALHWGVEPRAAWASVSPMWAPAGAALVLAETAGAAPAALCREAAARVRSDERHRLETAGAKVAVRLVLPLGLCFLPAFALLTVVPVVVAMASAMLTS